MQILGTGTRAVEILAPLTVAQTSVFTGPMALTSTLTLLNIQPSGTAGLAILKLDGTPAVKIHSAGPAQFFQT